MKNSSIISRAFESIPEDVKIQVNMSYDIADRIVELLDERGITKEQLADLTGKPVDEVVSWIGGGHNFSLETLAKLSQIFKRPLVSVNY